MSLPASALPDPIHLVHELEVHRVELEMQNQELRLAREERESLLARYTELFDFAPIGYITLDLRQSIREINHAGARILGLHRSQLVGTDFMSHLQRDQWGLLVALMDRILAMGSARQAAPSLELNSATGVPIRVTATAVASIRPLVLMAIEDITEQKSREARLETTQRELREADRRKDDFLAALSHELRNPLAPIRTGLHVLAHSPPTEERWKKAQAVVGRQVQHLSRLVDDLLDLNRVNHGKVQLKREPVELAPVLHATVEDHRSAFELHQLSLEHRSEQGPLWVHADPVRLTQIVSNLLSNAEKFTPPGGSVVVELRRAGDQAEIRVKDTGAGIPPSLVDQMFEAFAQAPQTLERTRGGLGLGLATVKGLVELHGGQVNLQSGGSGQGTEVVVRLPLVAPPQRVEAVVVPAAPRALRILVIDDNLDAAESLQDALALDGHSVEIANDGPSGLELARRLLPQVVICDIGLSGMDGYAVARAFRSEASLAGTYLLALTGYAQPEDVQRAAEAGFDRHLAKPTDLDVLYQAIIRRPEGGEPSP